MIHVFLVIYAGAVFLGSGVALMEIGRLLGKAFETRISAPWGVRTLVFIGAAILFGYGCVILFPGKAIQVRNMSVGLPMVGTVVLAMALWLLDHVTGEREPLPWTTDLLRLAAVLGWGATERATFALPPAAFNDAVPDEKLGCRLVRVSVLVGSIASVAGVALIILTTSLNH